MNPIPQENEVSNNSQPLNGNHTTPVSNSTTSTSINTCTNTPINIGPNLQQPQHTFAGNVTPQHFILHHRPSNGKEETYQTVVLMQDPNTSAYHNPPTTTTYVHQGYPYHNYVPTTCHPFTTVYDPASNHHIVRYEAYQAPSHAYHYSTVPPALPQNTFHPQHVVTLAHPSAYSVSSQPSFTQTTVLGGSSIHQHHIPSTPNPQSVASPLNNSQSKTSGSSPTNINNAIVTSLQNNNTSSLSNSPEEYSSPLELANSPSSSRDMISDHETLSPVSPFTPTKEPSLLERIHSASPPERKRSNSQSSVNRKGTNINKVKKKRSCARWTEEENKKLFEAYIKYDGKNWSSIAKAVGNKTSDQCNQHWWRVLNPEICKQPWSPEEDQRLIDRVKEVGESSWKKVSQGLKGRTDLQCRHRYNQLKKNSNKKPATDPREDSNQNALEDDRSVTETVVQQGMGYPEFYFHTAPVVSTTPVQYQHAPVEYRETVVAEGEVPPQLVVHQYQTQPIQHLQQIQPITQPIQHLQPIQTIQTIQPLPVQSLHAIPIQPIHAVHTVQPVVPPTHNVYHYIPVYQQPVNPHPPTFYQEVSSVPNEAQQESEEFFEPIPDQPNLDESTSDLDGVFNTEQRPEKDTKDYVAEIFDQEQRDAFD